MLTRNMKDSGIEWIGDIPEDWSSKRLKFLCEISTGTGDTQDKNDEGQYPFFVRSEKPKHIDFYTHNCLAILTAGDGDVGNIWHYIDGKFTAHQRVYIFNNFEEDIHPRYLYYYLKGLFILQPVLLQAKTTVASLRLPMLKEFPVLLSDINEQEKIAIVLDLKIDKINSIISDTQQSIIELKKYKQSLITETVTKGLDKTVEMKDSGIEVLGKINKDFRIISLGYLGDFQNGISKSGDSFGKGYPFVSYSDVYKNRVLPKKTTNLVQSTIEEQKNYSVRKNDIFFTRTSEIIEEIGMSSACYETIEQATFSGFVIRFRPNVNIFLVKFLRYFLEGSFVREYFSKEMNIVTRASLGQGLLKKLPIVLPSLEEQQQIVEFLDNKTSKIDSLIADKEKMITEYEAYKKSLIYEYVTGKKQV